MSFPHLIAYAAAPRLGFIGGRLANGGTFGGYTSQQQAVEAWVNNFLGTSFVWRKGGSSVLPSTVPGQVTASFLIAGPVPGNTYDPNSMRNDFDTNDAFAIAPRVATARVVSSAPAPYVKSAIADAMNQAFLDAPAGVLFEAFVTEDVPGSFVCTFIYYASPQDAIGTTPQNAQQTFSSLLGYAAMPKLALLKLNAETDSSSATACTNLVTTISSVLPEAILLRTGLVRDSSSAQYTAWAIVVPQASDTYA